MIGNIKTHDIRNAILKLLSAKYPTYKLYGNEVIEGYTKPSFFIDVRLGGMSDQTINTVEKEYRVHIVYFQKTKDNKDQYDKVEEIAELLVSTSKRNRHKKLVIEINDRFLDISEFSYDYTGKDNNILCIDFSIKFADWKEIIPEEPVMEEFNLNEELEKEE